MHPREHKFCTDKTVSYFDVSEVIVLLRSGDHYDACVRLEPGAFDHYELDMIDGTSDSVIDNTELDVTNPTESSVIGGTELNAINRTECDVDNSAEHDVINTVGSDVISTEPDVNALGGNDSFVDGANDNHDSDILDESMGDYLYHAKKYRNTNPRNCIIGHLNINSIRNKFDAVECILSEGLADIFAISETKLDDSFPLSQFSVTDFSIHRKDRNRHGGGIMLYVRSNIPHRRRIDLEPEPIKCCGTEMMIIETRLYKTEKWFIVVLYKPPKVNDKIFELLFSDLCNALQSESSHWFVMGDTNFDMNSDNPLCDLCVMYSLSNLVVGLTCFKSDNPTAVDVLLSSEPKRFKCALNTSCSLSDFHNFTCVATKLHKCYTSPRTIFYRSYKKFDDENFINDVKKTFPSLYVISSMMKTTVYGVSVNYCPVSLTAMPQSKRKFLRNLQYLIWIAVLDKLFIGKTCYAMRIKRKSQVGWLQKAEKFNYCYK